MLFGETMLRRVLEEYVAHYHAERNHQGRDNELLFPDPSPPAIVPRVKFALRCRERLGGLLKFDYRAAG